MSGLIANVCAILAYPFLVVGLLSIGQKWFRDGGVEADRRADGSLAIANALWAITSVLQGDRLWAAFNTLIALWCAWDWWRKRKRRDRAPRSLGAKSKARLAALVRKAREAAAPRPVLRPVPGGAR